MTSWLWKRNDSLKEYHRSRVISIPKKRRFLKEQSEPTVGNSAVMLIPGDDAEPVPEEDLLHGGDRGSVAGDAQLLSVHLQLRKQQLEPGSGTDKPTPLETETNAVRDRNQRR